MQLDEFVAQCLTQIVQGVVTAQGAVRPMGAMVNPHMRDSKDPTAAGEAEGFGGQPVYPVEFDIAVSASDNKSNTGKVGLEVLNIGLSTKRDSEQRVGTESRVRFKVPLFLPTQGW